MYRITEHTIHSDLEQITVSKGSKLMGLTSVYDTPTLIIADAMCESEKVNLLVSAKRTLCNLTSRFLDDYVYVGTFSESEGINVIHIFIEKKEKEDFDHAGTL
jgi:hypothetical protein